MSSSNIRDWRIRQIIYFQPNFEDPGQDHDAMSGLHPAIMVATIVAIMVANTAIIQRSYSDHTAIMPETGALL
jgi:hypothetical protein